MLEDHDARSHPLPSVCGDYLRLGDPDPLRPLLLGPWCLVVVQVSVDDYDRARRCFSSGVARCPGKQNVQLLQAWSLLELRAGNVDKARSLVQVR